MWRHHLINIAFALSSFLALALSSTITPAPTPTPISSYRDPFGGGTLISGSVNGTTTIWTASFSDASLTWETTEGTATDEVTGLIWSRTEQYSAKAGLYTSYTTGSCQVSSGGVRTWCTESWAGVANGTTFFASNSAFSGNAVSEFPLPTMTVSDGLLVPLTTNPILTPIPTPTSSSKINASALYRAFEC
jgi:hypothetical protein